MRCWSEYTSDFIMSISFSIKKKKKKASTQGEQRVNLEQARGHGGVAAADPEEATMAGIGGDRWEH